MLLHQNNSIKSNMHDRWKPGQKNQTCDICFVEHMPILRTEDTIDYSYSGDLESAGLSQTSSSCVWNNHETQCFLNERVRNWPLVSIASNLFAKLWPKCWPVLFSPSHNGWFPWRIYHADTLILHRLSNFRACHWLQLTCGQSCL